MPHLPRPLKPWDYPTWRTLTPAERHLEIARYLDGIHARETAERVRRYEAAGRDPGPDGGRAADRRRATAATCAVLWMIAAGIMAAILVAVMRVVDQVFHGPIQ